MSDFQLIEFRSNPEKPNKWKKNINLFFSLVFALTTTLNTYAQVSK